MEGQEDSSSLISSYSKKPGVNMNRSHKSFHPFLQAKIYSQISPGI